ncbi:hypothetical protein [Devosia marina]|uniref:Uncharacterized protein n=1 Tax=Devosia marina TaxID=2683198 RepID=A0A7X3FQS8_9HYPH|nr:hypothetical protein [Devosia marina]MVS98890.1 hypothetical protein [Devosia marina]
MHITDGELGLAMGVGAAIRNIERNASNIIAQRDRQLAAAQRKIAALEAELNGLRRDRASSNLALLQSLKR